MKGRQGSWWGWLVAAVVILAVLGDTDIPVLPLIIGFVVLSSVLGRRRPVGPQRGARDGGRPVPRVPDDRDDAWPPRGAGAGAPAPPQDGPMPTIDVPRYPGGGPSGGQPPPAPSTGPAGTPAPRAADDPYAAAPTPVPTPAPSGAAHTSTDPVVSLGQLHLARCGRDLQSATQHGTATDVARVLDEIRDLSRRMQDMLGAAEGTPGSGRREFRAGLRALDRLVEDARGEHPPGARLTRVTQTCLRMGQTGRHE